MYSSNQKGQCLICFDSLDDDYNLFSLLYQPDVCQNCLNSFKRTSGSFHFGNYPLIILYQYNEFFKKLLFNYKGRYDYALKDAFLINYVLHYQKKYAHHLVVIAPSSDKDNQRRGFCPNLAVVQGFSANIFTGITKKYFYKQTSQTRRENVKYALQIEGGALLEDQKVLIFDDVITSGSTVGAIIKLIEPCHPASIEVLVLASSQLDKFTVRKKIFPRFRLPATPKNS